MITLLGATGYTGIRTARELDRSGVPYRLAGRNAARLSALSEMLPTHPETLLVDLDDTLSINELLKNTRVLINCAGPFTDLGERVVRQAAVSGVHYLDPSNELSYVVRMRSYHRLAQKAGAILSPSCAFEVALSDCAAAQYLTPGIHWDEIRIVYDMPGATPSLGTRRSTLRSLATSWVTYRGGRWVGQAPVTHSFRERIDGRWLSAIAIPSCESVTLPEHLSVDTVLVGMTVTRRQAVLGPIFVPFFARFLRSIAGPWMQQWLGANAKDPASLPDEDATFTIQVSAQADARTQTIRVRGRNPYEMTGKILSHASICLLENPPGECGVLPPSRLLGNRWYDVAAQWGITIETTQVSDDH